MVKENISMIDFFQERESVSSWQEALNIASSPLIESEKITSIYLENMVRAVFDLGPYMVLTDGFALMHAQAGIGVNITCTSLLKLKEPIDLEGKSVSIFLVLASKNNEEHLQIVKRIFSILSESESIETLAFGNLENLKQLFRGG